MKLFPLFLAASLAANAVCVAVYLIHEHSVTTATKSTQSTAAAKVGASADAAANGAAKAGDDSASIASLAQVRAQLEAGDLTTLVARLRAAGFSAKMIRAIVLAQVNEQFNERRKAIMGNSEDRPFWKNQNLVFSDPKTGVALRELNKEQSNLMKSLLGADANDASIWMRRQYGNLAPEKFAQLQSINSDYEDLMMEIRSKSNGVMLPEDRKKIAFLEKERQADIAKTLTPQELEESQLRSSPAANEVRGRLGSFEATESEFRAMYKLQADFDAKYSLREGMLSPEVMAARNEAEKQLKTAILAALPPDRAAEYKHLSDPAYQQVSRLVTRLELPPAAVQQVLTVQQDIQSRVAAVRNDTTLSSENRNAQLLALQQEANTKLSTALTPRGLEAYKESGGGRWIQATSSSAAGTRRTLPTMLPGR